MGPCISLNATQDRQTLSKLMAISLYSFHRSPNTLIFVIGFLYTRIDLSYQWVIPNIRVLPQRPLCRHLLHAIHTGTYRRRLLRAIVGTISTTELIWRSRYSPPSRRRGIRSSSGRLRRQRLFNGFVRIHAFAIHVDWIKSLRINYIDIRDT